MVSNTILVFVLFKRREKFPMTPYKVGLEESFFEKFSKFSFESVENENSNKSKKVFLKKKMFCLNANLFCISS